MEMNNGLVLSKARGIIRFTNEALAGILEIPDGVAVHNITYDADREIVSLHLSSENETDFTSQTVQGTRVNEFPLK